MLEMTGDPKVVILFSSEMMILFEIETTHIFIDAVAIDTLM